MADATIEYTSTGSGSKSYSAYASDSCGNKDYGTWYWGGDTESKGQSYVLGTAGLTFSQSNGKFTLTGPTKGNAPNFNLVWKSPKVNNGATTYTVSVVFNILGEPVCIGENFSITDSYDSGADASFTFNRTLDANLSYDDLNNMYYDNESGIININSDGQFGAASFKLTCTPESSHGGSAIVYKIRISQISGAPEYMANIQGPNYDNQTPYVSLSVGCGTGSTCTTVIRNNQYNLPGAVTFGLTTGMRDMTVGYQLYFHINNKTNWSC